jgi:hypothetical protein
MRTNEMPPALYAPPVATVVIGITEFAVLRDQPVGRSARLYRNGDRPVSDRIVRAPSATGNR